MRKRCEAELYGRVRLASAYSGFTDSLEAETCGPLLVASADNNLTCPAEADACGPHLMTSAHFVTIGSSKAVECGCGRHMSVDYLADSSKAGSTDVNEMTSA